MAIDVTPSHRIIRTRRHLRAAPPVVARRGPALDHDYWVAHCEGYRVESHEGRLGFVDEVSARTRPTRRRRCSRSAPGCSAAASLVVPAEDSAYDRAARAADWLRAPVTIADSEAA